MYDNPVVNHKIFRNYGWLVKASKVMCENPGMTKSAFNVGLALGATGLASVIGGGVYSALERAKIRKMERKRELAGAIGDALERQRLTDLYNAAGLQTTASPMLLSKNVAPKYQATLQSMGSSIE